MSALHEKIALRRMLHDFVCQLDETIVESMSFQPEETQEPTAACQFCDDCIVAWHDQRHVFSSSTYLLLQQFFAAPKRMLSKEDVRQDVLFNDDAGEGCIRQCISEARKEIQRTGFPYRIETIIRKGYRLVAE
jgi:DNA-binding response OmpR family regulator